MPEVEEEEDRQDQQMAGLKPEATQPGAELQQQQQQSSAPLQGMASTDREALVASTSGTTVTEGDGVPAAGSLEAVAVAPVALKPVSTETLIMLIREWSSAQAIRSRRELHSILTAGHLSEVIMTYLFGAHSSHLVAPSYPKAPS